MTEEILRELTAGVRSKMNYFAIGDVHGELFKLKSLIGRLFLQNDDVIVMLGDYIDRGKHSFEVIDYLIELSKQFKCVFLKGNHELMFMDYLSGINEDIFLWNGGKKTLLSYEKNGYNAHYYNSVEEREIPVSHLDFFRGLQPYYEVEDYIFVHAGIFPDTPMENMPDEILYWDRSFVYNAAKYKGKTVVCGHSPASQVLETENVICIDTGACFERMGNLTCVKLPAREFIKQGPVLEDLADEESISS